MAVTLVAVDGSSPAKATEEPPAPLETWDGAGPLGGVDLGSQPGSEARRPGRPMADASGGFIYRNGRYTTLDSADGLLTVRVAINNGGQTAGPY
jgi:hypothetical protein